MDFRAFSPISASPETILTRHFPQVPFPAQGASISISSLFAQSSTDSSGFTENFSVFPFFVTNLIVLS
jgi:hypothetical protein